MYSSTNTSALAPATAQEAAAVSPHSALRKRALRDSFYRDYALEGADDSALTAAGLFIDRLELPADGHPSWNVTIPTTPLGKLQDQLGKVSATMAPPEKLVVLLCTGSYAPVHNGHLAMMDRARAALERAGYVVVAGYLSPSHDHYVKEKQNGLAALNCEHRIALLEEALADSDWLSVCPWEARYAPTSLNFTDVLRRLQHYLKHQLPSAPELEVAYVFGADNSAFLHAFEARGLAVCVTRPPLSAPSIPLKHATRWFSASLASAGSSTQVRAGDLTLMKDSTRLRYEALRWPVLTASDSETKSTLYLVREDISYGTGHWPEIDQTATTEFETQLKVLLADYLNTKPVAPRVQGLSLAHQKELQRRLVESSPHSVLSLDACIPAKATLAVSRRFDLADGQVFSKTQVARPGRPPVAEQLRLLPSAAVQLMTGSTAWLVLDDDRASGTTERAVRSILKQAGHTVASFAYLNQLQLAAEGQEQSAVQDIVDARDFLLGAADAGLVVRLPNGQTARAPYMLPYVNLVFRAKLYAPSQMAASLALWRLNENWLRQFTPRRTVSDAAEGTRNLLHYLGFTSDTPLHLVANHMATWLMACTPLD